MDLVGFKKVQFLEAADRLSAQDRRLSITSWRQAKTDATRTGVQKRIRIAHEADWHNGENIIEPALPMLNPEGYWVGKELKSQRKDSI